MSKETKHTPTPWTVESGAIFANGAIPIAHMDREIGNGTVPVERDENAKFIARACNNYPNARRRHGAIITKAVDQGGDIVYQIAEQVSVGGCYVVWPGKYSTEDEAVDAKIEAEADSGEKEGHKVPSDADCNEIGIVNWDRVNEEME